MPQTIIRPRRGGSLDTLREAWAYREVLLAFVSREVKIRYAQTALGLGWILLQPVLTTSVLSLLAGRWLKIPADGVPYPLFAYAGLVPWLYFTHVLTRSSTCLLDTGLLSKVYFPRLLLPMSTAIGGLIDLGVASVPLALLMSHYGYGLTWSMAMLPLCLLFLTAMAFGMGLWLSVINLYFRDVMHTLPFVTQLLFFVTPIAYSSHVVPPEWQFIYSVNPMVGAVECWRSALFGRPLEVPLTAVAISFASAAIILVTGLLYFDWEAPLLSDVGNL